MVTTAPTCPHPPGSWYWDSDEERCRLCNDSITFPRRPPTADDQRDRKQDLLAIAGERRRRPAKEEVEEEVEEAAAAAKAAAEEKAKAAAPVLLCTCCHETLPLDAFYVNRKAVHREQRGYACRRCTAFRQRVKLATGGEAMRQRNRERMRKYMAQPEKRKAHNESAKKRRESQNAAGRRRNARDAGLPVPIQRAGRAPIYLKQVCRISESCPLREFCTTENKGLE